MGRIGVDIYPDQVGVSLRDVSSFGKYLGGSAANVAVAAARLGRRSGVITRTGQDPFGEFLRQSLQEYGVDVTQVETVAGLPTPVTFCEIFPPDHFPIYFYRSPKAPDLEIRPEELDYDAIDNAEIFWVTATGLSQEPSRSASRAALQHRDRRGITILDLDYRPMFWSSRENARAAIHEVLPYVSVALGNLDEVETAVETRDPYAAARLLHEAGVDLAVVKQGPGGVYASDRDGDVRLSSLPVDVVNGLGAGDAFGGAMCHALLSNWDLERCMRFANAAGAIVAGKIACSDGMPTTAEVEAVSGGALNA